MEMHKQFMRLCEYVSAVPLTEEGEEDEDPTMGNQDPNAMGGEDPTMSNQGPNDMGGEDPTMGNQDPNAMDDPNAGPQAQGPNDMGGEDPNAMGSEIPPMEDPTMGEENEIIDVDDITNAQEKTNDKVNKVGRNLGKVDDKIVQLLQAIDKMETMINNNNAEIENFKQEFEKRNPTPTEKLNLRSLDSYPFNVNPKEYWENKGISNPSTSNQYQAYSDNGKSTTDEYEITNYDIDNFDERKVADSFHIDDDLRQTIEKIFDI